MGLCLFCCAARDFRSGSSLGTGCLSLVGVGTRASPSRSPSQKVLHMRALPPGCNSDDIVAFMRQFGTVAYVVMLPKRGQALVEMESLGSSQAVMTFAETNEVWHAPQSSTNTA